MSKLTVIMKFISVIPTAGNHFLTEKYKEDRVLLLGVQNRTAGNRHKLENRKSQLSIRSCRTPEQVVQSLSLEILRTWLDMMLTTCSKDLLWAGCSRWTPEVPSNLRVPQIASVQELCVLQHCSNRSVLLTPSSEEREEASLLWVEFPGIYLNNVLERKGRWLGQISVGFCITLSFWGGFKNLKKYFY